MSGLGSVRARVIALAGVIVVLLAAGSWIAISHASAQSTHNGGAAGKSGTTAAHSSRSAAPKVPLTVISVTPAQHAQRVSGTTPIKVQLSTALASDSPMPVILPKTAGTWQSAGTDTIEFVPATGFAQLTHVRVRIPAGPAGLRAADGSTLAQRQVVRYHVGAYDQARLAELLAQLGYLPLTWAPTSGAAPAQSATAQLAAAYSAPAGSFTWKPGYPAALHRLWAHGAPGDEVIHGAVMAFESEHGMTLDGIAGPAVWKALLTAAAAGVMNKNGYSYALASQHAPETLTVWHDGRRIFRNPANTGIPAAPTTVGTAPVYLKYTFQIMKGTNPDGSKYADPVSWVSYFRAGEAVHYFPRGSYGYQQSLGCVELPLGPAHFIWKYLTYGTLVTVTPA
jgi:peptidoglycan hydrolase-like protein with peptidoglycan-binding domain